MLLTDGVKRHLSQTARTLKGSERRLFMARTVQLLGRGGQRRAERELGWNRHTIIKGLHELQSGIVCLDAFSQRGRRRAEERLPHLLDDIKAIVDSQSQTDPRFRTWAFADFQLIRRRDLPSFSGYSPSLAARPLSRSWGQLLH